MRRGVSQAETLAIAETAATLRIHGIATRVQGNVLLARDSYTTQAGAVVDTWVAVGDMRTAELYRWMGY